MGTVLNFSVDWGCGNERLVIIKTLIYHSRKLNQIQLTNSCEILWSILREYEIITISVHGSRLTALAREVCLGFFHTVF